MVDRQSKELYQQQLAAHAAWIRRGAPGYAAAAAAQHPGFATPAHGSSANAAYENYVLQNMFGGASNILGSGGKEMSGFASPFRLPGQFANFNYQRPLPAHSPLTAHMKNSTPTSNPIAAHMMSNPYQYPGNYGLNSYGAGAMNPNYLQSNMAVNQSQETANYMNQSAERFRQQFEQQSQYEKESSLRQENSRRQAGMLNGGITGNQEATNAFNLQQLQAAYSQAALSSSSAMTKENSKSKTPANNYSAYYPTPQTSASHAAAAFSGMSSTTDLNDQVAKELLSRFGDRLTPQLLQAIQQTASLNQSFQQSPLSIPRQDPEEGEKGRQGGKGESTKISTAAQDLRQQERNSSTEYTSRQGVGKESRSEQHTSKTSDLRTAASGVEALLNASGQHIRSGGEDQQRSRQDYSSPYNAINFNSKSDESQKLLADYTAQYQRSQKYSDPRSMVNNVLSSHLQQQQQLQPQLQPQPKEQQKQNTRTRNYSSSSEMKTPAVSPIPVQSPLPSQQKSPAVPPKQNSQPVSEQNSPAALQQSSPAPLQQNSPANSQVSSANQFSPNQVPSASPKMSPYSQQSSIASPYSQPSPKLSPYSQVSPAYLPSTQSNTQPSPSYQTQSIKSSYPSHSSPAYPPQSSPAYPPQTSPAYPPQTSPAYPPHNSPAYPIQSSPAYPPQNSPAYPPQNSPAYPPQSSPAYPPQNSPAYPPQNSPAYPPQNSPAYLSQNSPIYPPQKSPAYPPQGSPAYQPQNSPAYLPQNSPAYPPQNSPAYPPQSSPAYPPQNSPAYPPQSSPAYPPQSSPAYPPQNSPAYPAPGSPSYPTQSPSYIGNSQTMNSNFSQSKPSSVPGSSQQTPDSFSVPSFQQNKETRTNSSLSDSSSKPSEKFLVSTQSSLRSNTDSPRLDTPPGLTLPVSSDDASGPHTLPILNTPVNPRTESSAPVKNSSKPSSSSSIYPGPGQNPISGMASMTNKIKMLESKMQISKSKSNMDKSIEDNSLKNWWKPQIEKKVKSSIPSSPSIPPLPSPPTPPKSSKSLPVPDIDDKKSGSRTKDMVSAPLEHLISQTSSLSPGYTGGKTSTEEVSLNGRSKLKPENRQSISVPSVSSTSVRKESNHTEKPKPVSQVNQSSHPNQPSKKQLHSSSKSVPEPAPVPSDVRSSRSGSESYATPNLERMEIKNSGIPGPSAVTWKRKSTEDSPITFHQSKKRKLNKPSTGNDIYQFDEEEKDVKMKNSKDDQGCKGPVYKYKSALINRDYDSDSNQSRPEKKLDDEMKDIEKDDNSSNSSQEHSSVSKKKKRPKHEEWSVVKERPSKSSKNDIYEFDMKEKYSKKEPREVPLRVDESSDRFEKSIEVSVPTSAPTTQEAPKKEAKVAVDKWYQAFGAGDKGKKKPEKNLLLKDNVKEEPEEKTFQSILDIPPEIRRKPRPNFGGIIHFSPDWSRSVRRLHERCKVPADLDSSSRLKPKILVGQTTPKKSYEDFARKDMVSPPDILMMERVRMEKKTFTDILSPETPEELGGELPSIVETIIENRKKLRQAATMGRMYQIPFKKEKKRLLRMRMTKMEEVSVTENNMGLIPTPGLPMLTPDLIQSNPSFGSFRHYTLNKYLDFGESGKPKPDIWTAEILDSKTRSKLNSSALSPSIKEVFGVDTPLKKIKSKAKEKPEPKPDDNLTLDEPFPEPDKVVNSPQKVKKGKVKKDILTEKTKLHSLEKQIHKERIPDISSLKEKVKVFEKPVLKEKILDKTVSNEKFVPVEKEVDDTFAFSQEIGEPTEEETILQTELGGFALDLLDDNPSWIKQVTIQNLVVWEPIEPVSTKKKKPKRKRGKKSGWDFPTGKRKSKTSRDVSRAGSPLQEEIHDIEYTLEKVVQESNRWVVDKNAGETILQRAAKMGYPDVVAYTVAMQDASVKEKDYAGFMPLDKASFRGHHDVVKVLLKYGADPSHGVKGTRALHDAVEGMSRETVHALLSYGADPLLHNYSGSMPIDLAEGNINMKKYLTNILADLHGKPPNVRGSLPPVERWNVSGFPEFHDPMLDPRFAETVEEEKEEPEDIDSFMFEASSHPLPTEFQLMDREGDFVLYRELKEFARRFGHHKGDIKTKCYIIELKKSEFLKTSHCKVLDRRRLEVRYHEREEEDTIILVKVDKFVRKIFDSERSSIPR